MPPRQSSLVSTLRLHVGCVCSNCSSHAISLSHVTSGVPEAPAGAELAQHARASRIGAIARGESDTLGRAAPGDPRPTGTGTQYGYFVCGSARDYHGRATAGIAAHSYSYKCHTGTGLHRVPSSTTYPGMNTGQLCELALSCIESVAKALDELVKQWHGAPRATRRAWHRRSSR